MSKEAIAAIREAEEKAHEIIFKADENAKAMIRDAEKKAAQLKNQTEMSNAIELDKKLEAMSIKAAALIEKSVAEAGAEAEELMSKAEMKTLSAVKKIVWEIIEA
ncbi:MAG: hypothetical protein IJ303_05865 [Clostridia bacterium]|nr:hypothetical protein [Clostridia bacterium]